MNKMTFVLLLASAVLAACGQKSVDDQATAAAPAESTSNAANVTKLDSPLPNGLSLPFRYHVRADRVQPLDATSQLRMIDIDVLDLDEAAASREIAGMLEDAGFHGSSESPAKGGTRITYRRADGGKVSVITWDRQGRKVHARGAKSSAYLGWTVPVTASVSTPTP